MNKLVTVNKILDHFENKFKEICKDIITPKYVLYFPDNMEIYLNENKFNIEKFKDLNQRFIAFKKLFEYLDNNSYLLHKLADLGGTVRDRIHYPKLKFKACDNACWFDILKNSNSNSHNKYLISTFQY